MTFRKIRKYLLYSSILTAITTIVVQVNTTPISSRFNAIALNSANVISTPSLKVKGFYGTSPEQTDHQSSFEFTDKNLNQWFLRLITNKHDALVNKYLDATHTLSLNEIYQTYVMNYLAWHWTRETNWQIPIDFNIHFNRLPVYPSDVLEDDLGSDVSVYQLGHHIDNHYLYGGFANEGKNGSKTWDTQRVFDFTDIVKENIGFQREQRDLIGFGNMVVQTQDLTRSCFRGSNYNYIDLARINEHQFGESIVSDWRFPRSGAIHVWDDKNDPPGSFNFSAVQRGEFKALKHHSSFNSTFSNVWSWLVKNYVSRKTLLVADKDSISKFSAPLIPYLDASKLFQLGSVGYDHSTNQYWYSVNFNQSFLKGAIGAYYDKDVAALLTTDFLRDKLNLNLSNYDYWSDLNNTKPMYITGGTSTWVDINKLKIDEQKQYPLLIQRLAAFLMQCVKGKLLTYDNYFNVKKQIQNYVEKNKTFPTNDWIGYEIGNNENWRDNGWVDCANKYNLNSDSLLVLALLLPEIRFSQFSMFDVTGTGNGDWSNSDQRWNVGVTGTSENDRTSSYMDILMGKNKVVLDASRLKQNSTVNIMFNLGIVAALQNNNRFDFKDNYAVKNDLASGAYYLECNNENADEIGRATNGNVQVKNDSWIQTGSHSIGDFNYYQIKRDGEKIVLTNQIVHNKIAFKNSLKSQLPSKIWFDTQKLFPNDPVEAVKSLFEDEDGQPSLPFCRADLWTNSFLDYKLPPNCLYVKTDDELGTLTVHLTDSTDYVQVTGLKHEKQTPDQPRSKVIPSPRITSLFFDKTNHDSLLTLVTGLIVGCAMPTLWFKFRSKKNKQTDLIHREQ